MSKRRALSSIRKHHSSKAALYRCVFDSFVVRALVMVMVGFFLLQPTSMVFASEEVSVDTPTAESESDIGSEVPDAASDTEEELAVATEIEDASTETAQEDVSEIETATESEVAPSTGPEGGSVESETVATSTPSVTSGADVSLDATTTPLTSTSTEVATSTETVAPEVDEQEAAESEAEGEEEGASETEEEVPTEENVPPPTSTEVSPHSESAHHQFAKDECVLVGDGSYYCNKDADGEATQSETSLVASLDEEGDHEIYLRIKGEVLQLSDNTVEDLAPQYDPISESVVWHRLEAGRYEIVSYDLNDEAETVLTDNAVNDMEPDRSGDYTVWQRWEDDNWEVILFDGEEETRITHNATHDVAPSVRGEFVIWHTNDGNGERKVAVYDINTGLISEISDPEGGVVENPRFVLVYDTTFENGDVITKGYDFESGEVAPLSAVPGDLPEELPEPDQTGETRALIQTKSTSREEGEGEDLDLSPEGPAATSTTTSTTDTTIDLSETPENEIIELTEFDLVIPSPATSTASSTQ